MRVDWADSWADVRWPRPRLSLPHIEHTAEETSLIELPGLRTHCASGWHGGPMWALSDIFFALSGNEGGEAFVGAAADGAF